MFSEFRWWSPIEKWDDWNTCWRREENDEKSPSRNEDDRSYQVSTPSEVDKISRSSKQLDPEKSNKIEQDQVQVGDRVNFGDENHFGVVSSVSEQSCNVIELKGQTDSTSIIEKIR